MAKIGPVLPARFFLRVSVLIMQSNDRFWPKADAEMWLA
jgi:hypothetical protein